MVPIFRRHVLEIDLVERIRIQRVRKRQSKHAVVDVASSQRGVRVHLVATFGRDSYDGLNTQLAIDVMSAKKAFPGVVGYITLPERYAGCVIVRYHTTLLRKQAVSR